MKNRKLFVYSEDSDTAIAARNVNGASLPVGTNALARLQLSMYGASLCVEHTSVIDVNENELSYEFITKEIEYPQCAPLDVPVLADCAADICFYYSSSDGVLYYNSKHDVDAILISVTEILNKLYI